MQSKLETIITDSQIELLIYYPVPATLFISLNFYQFFLNTQTPGNYCNPENDKSIIHLCLDSTPSTIIDKQTRLNP